MTDHRMSWQNPRILWILLLVFTCGATAGMLTMRLGFASGARRSASTSYWKEGSKEIHIERFRKELDLTPDQTRQMELVLTDFVTYYQTLQEQMNEVRSSGKQRILQILNEDQKQKFLQMISDWQNKQLR